MRFVVLSQLCEVRCGLSLQVADLWFVLLSSLLDVQLGLKFIIASLRTAIQLSGSVTLFVANCDVV